MNIPETEVEEQPEQQDEGLLSRWAKRKRAVLQEKKALDEQERPAELHKAEEAALEEAALLTDKDMPPIELLTADSDFSGFMSPKVSEALRGLALRKLFHGAEFNICDGLDDYDGDYTSFEKLGNIVTADIKHRIELEARKKLEAVIASGEAEGEGKGKETETVVKEAIAEGTTVEETTVKAITAEETIAEEAPYAGEDGPDREVAG